MVQELESISCYIVEISCRFTIVTKSTLRILYRFQYLEVTVESLLIDVTDCRRLLYGTSGFFLVRAVSELALAGKCSELDESVEQLLLVDVTESELSNSR